MYVCIWYKSWIKEHGICLGSPSAFDFWPCNPSLSLFLSLRLSFISVCRCRSAGICACCNLVIPERPRAAVSRCIWLIWGWAVAELMRLSNSIHQRPNHMHHPRISAHINGYVDCRDMTRWHETATSRHGHRDALSQTFMTLKRVLKSKRIERTNKLVWSF